jgi:hypothetical protein
MLLNTVAENGGMIMQSRMDYDKWPKIPQNYELKMQREGKRQRR